MKILVCISHVPDTTAKINFSPDNKKFITQGVTFIINPYDEIALARAIELTEGGKGTVSVINVGDASTEPTLRKALAIGAADAIRVNAAPSDTFFVASQIAQVIKENQYDLILCGRESSDHNGSAVPSMVAELLEIPSVTFVKKLNVNEGKATVERDIEGGKEVLNVPFPFVAGAAEGVAEPKIPNMRGIMSARTKPLVVKEPVSADQKVKVVGYDKPPVRSAVKMLSVEESGMLWEKLREERKII